MSMPNSGKHIETVIARTPCNRHKAKKGDSCWTIYYGSTGGAGQGVCNERVRRAGYNGRVSATSIRRGGPPSKTKDTSRYTKAA